MPIQVFKCPQGHQFEKIVRAGTEEVACPECGSTTSEKVITAPSFHLKGDGWAKDNYGGGK